VIHILPIDFAERPQQRRGHHDVKLERAAFLNLLDG